MTMALTNLSYLREFLQLLQLSSLLHTVSLLSAVLKVVLCRRTLCVGSLCQSFSEGIGAKQVLRIPGALVCQGRSSSLAERVG